MINQEIKIFIKTNDKLITKDSVNDFLTMFGFSGMKSNKTEVVLFNVGPNKNKQCQCQVYFATFKEADAAIKTLQEEQLTCRQADGVAEQLDPSLTGDLVGSWFVLEVGLKKNLKEQDMGHIHSNQASKVKVTEGEKKLSLHSECKDSLVLIRDYILSEWKEVIACVINQFDATARRDYRFEVGEQKFDSLKECAEIIDSVKWIEFQDEEKHVPYFVNITSRDIIWDRPAEKTLGCAEVMELMNIQNELNRESTGENLKIENHVDAVERIQKEEANSKVEDYIQLISNPDSKPSNIQNPAPVQQNSLLASELANKQRQGPPGANLFIFHLPNDWTEVELTNCFKEYGNVISARIECDKETGRSKGQGFVSFDNAMSAYNSMQSMNGKAVSNKRLKVQLKKGDEKPHMNNNNIMMDTSGIMGNLGSNMLGSEFVNNVAMGYGQDINDMDLLGINSYSSLINKE